MFTNWLTYRSVAEGLDRSLKGAEIVEIFSQYKNELLLVLAKEDKEYYLQFSAQPRAAWLLLKPEFSRARKNSVDLFPRLRGKTIRDVSIATTDRIIRIGLGDDEHLFAVLFSSGANVIHIDSSGVAADSFKKKLPGIDLRSLSYDNSLPPLKEDEFTQDSNDRGNRTSQDEFDHKSTDLTVLKFLGRVRPWLHGTLAKEVLWRCGIENETRLSELDGDRISILYAGCLEAVQESARGECLVYLQDRTPIAVSLIRLNQLDDGSGGPECEKFADVGEGLFFYLRKQYSGSEFSGLKQGVLSAAKRMLDKSSRSLVKLAETAALRKRADEYEKFGNLLMIHLYDEPEHPTYMTVPDIFVDTRIVVQIPLKREMTVLENAQRYFEKAQNERASIQYVQERRTMLTQRASKLTDFLTLLDAATNTKELKSLFKQQAELMDNLGYTDKGKKDDKPFPFRRFKVAGGFEVWVGKSSANNDELTMRHSRPNDIWMHARGVGGSHVVIKVGSAEGNPGKDSIRQAAAIAAYYSKYRKAGTVPVAYTEKKYVRKPKGAAPGSVTMEREKVVLIKPGLPEGSEESS